MAAIFVTVLGWGLIALLVIAWLTDDASAAHLSAKRGKVRVLTAGQGAAASGQLRIRIAVPAVRRGKSPKAGQRIRINVFAKQPWSKRVRAAAVVRRIFPGRRKTVRVKLARPALDLIRNCGAPTVAVRARGVRLGSIRGWKARPARRTLRRQASRCALPAGVNPGHADRCEFIASPENPCLGTFPNDHFTRADRSSATGRRLDLAPGATPANVGGVHISVEELNRSDGFSPGPMISVRIPGLDNQAAFDRTGLVPEGDMSRTYAADQPALLIDSETGRRHLIWAELDGTATADENRSLIIRPGQNLVNGRRYIVALRNLEDADGRPLAAPAGFRLYRDNRRTSNRAVESRRPHFERIFRELAGAGVKRGSLHLAWDFTVASTENLTSRMLSIRDRAFAGLGDHDLTDGSIAGTQAPAFTVTEREEHPTPTGAGEESIRTVTGTFQVPCFLDKPGCPPTSTFDLDENQIPIRTPGNVMTARFTCNIPRSAVVDDGGTLKVSHKVRPSLYGHGLFGSLNEVNGRNIRQLGHENGVIVCGTDWSGMSNEDVVTAAMPALLDLSRFPALPDRLQQGFLNFLFLGRLMIHPQGFAADEAFRFDGESVIDTSDLFYYGNSQGGIAGGALTAVATDFTRSVLYVPGINYSTLLTRSVDFDLYKGILYPNYTEEKARPLIFALMQTMWDRGEPNGYANHMTDDPLPGTPAHKVLIQMAYGDHQVANVATEVEARTIGAPLRLPAVDGDRLPTAMVNPWFGHETLGDLAGPAADGSGFFVWDIGPKRMEGDPARLFGTDPAPIGNLPPKTSDSDGDGSDGSGIDPHDTVIRSSPLIRKQIADFLKTDGRITDPCGAGPCYAAGWKGMP